jgi:iron complex outermembrane receptor protein
MSRSHRRLSSDTVAMDIEGLVKKGDGFVDNVVTGRDDDGGYDNWSIRTGMNIDLSDRVSMLLRYQHSDTDDASTPAMHTFKQDGEVYAGSSVPPKLITPRYDQLSSTDQSDFKSNSDVVQPMAIAKLDIATLTSYTQYRNEKTLTGAAVWLLKLPVKDETSARNCCSHPTPGGRLQWTTRLLYFEYTDEFRPIEAQALGNPYAQIAGSTSTTRSYAAYRDATYEVVDDLFLIAGVRYSHDEFVDAEIFDGSGFSDVPDVRFDRVTPRAVVRYALNNLSSVYASYNRGYKAGLIDLGNNKFSKSDHSEYQPKINHLSYTTMELVMATQHPSCMRVSPFTHRRFSGESGPMRFLPGSWGFSLREPWSVACAFLHIRWLASGIAAAIEERHRC